MFKLQDILYELLLLKLWRDFPPSYFTKLSHLFSLDFYDCIFLNQQISTRRFIHGYSSNPVTFSRCTFRNMNSIFISGRFTAASFTDCFFTGIQTSFFLTNKVSDYTINRCQFVNNSVRESLWSNADDLSSTRLTILSSTFYNNTNLSYSGSVLFPIYGLPTYQTISSCTFIGTNVSSPQILLSTGSRSDSTISL